MDSTPKLLADVGDGTTAATAATAGKTMHSRPVVYLVILVWMILNMAFSLINKYLFSHMGFTFPILLVSANLFATSIVLWLGVIMWSGWDGIRNIWTMTKRCWKLLLLIAIFTGTDLVFENASLVAVPVSLNQVVKALGPVLLVIVSRILEKKRYSVSVYASTAVLALGTGLAVYRNPEGNFWGIFAAFMSAFLAVSKTVVAAIVLERENVTALGITIATSLPSVLFIFPLYFVYEHDDYTSYVQMYPGTTAAALFVTSAMAVVYNWIHFKLVDVVGSIASGVVGVIKLPILITLSVWLWGSVLLWYNWFGMVLACVGLAFYQYFRPIGASAATSEGVRAGGIVNVNDYELLAVNTLTDSTTSGERDVLGTVTVVVDRGPESVPRAPLVFDLDSDSDSSSDDLAERLDLL